MGVCVSVEEGFADEVLVPPWTTAAHSFMHMCHQLIWGELEEEVASLMSHWLVFSHCYYSSLISCPFHIHFLGGFSWGAVYSLLQDSHCVCSICDCVACWDIFVFTFLLLFAVCAKCKIFSMYIYIYYIHFLSKSSFWKKSPMVSYQSCIYLIKIE